MVTIWNRAKYEYKTILPKYEYISSLIVNAWSYNLTKGSHDEGIRARIVLKPNKLTAPNSLMIIVKSVPISFNYLNFRIHLDAITIALINTMHS